MGFLDSLIGVNTTRSTDAATAAQIPQLWGATAGANQILKDTTAKARTDLTGYTGQANTALSSGYDAATGQLQTAGAAAQNQLNQRTDQAAGTALAGNQAFQPYADAGANATGLYSDALGLGGQAGHDRAVSAFQASPGYAFQRDQAADLASRKASSLGIAGSGNTLDALTRLGSNLADSEYSNWAAGLKGLGDSGLMAASGISANDKTASGYQSTAGTIGSQLQQQLGGLLGTASAQKGTGIANQFTSLGTSLGSNDTLLGRLISSNNMSAAENTAGLAMGDAKADDSAANANAGILSKLLGGALSLPMGGGASLGGSLLGGLSSSFKL